MSTQRFYLSLSARSGFEASWGIHDGVGVNQCIWHRTGIPEQNKRVLEQHMLHSSKNTPFAVHTCRLLKTFSASSKAKNIHHFSATVTGLLSSQTLAVQLKGTYYAKITFAALLH